MTRTVTPSRSIQLPRVMLGGYLSFMVQGAAATFYGPALVYISAETGQPVASLGILFVLHWLGFFASTMSVNALARRLEIRRSLLLGLGLVMIGALGLVALPFPVNLGSAFFMGFGSGVLEVLMNRTVEFLAGESPARALNRVHSTFGVGAVVIPLVVAGVGILGLNWRIAILAVIFIGAAQWAVIWRWPDPHVPHGANVQWGMVPWRSILLFVLMFVVYVGAETAVGAWATTYFTKLGQGEILGAVATSFFFLTFSIGRLLLASFPERIGYARTVRIFSLLAGAALLLTLDAGLALIGFALAGVVYSVIFPTLLAWAARRHPEIRAQMASISIASAGAGGIVLPYLIGLGVGAFGAPALSPMLVVVTLLIAVLALFEPELNRKAIAANATGD